MEYCKIRTNGTIEVMPNPININISNPTEEQKALIAEMFGWLEKVDTEQPAYDEETQYLTVHFEEENGKAVQKWDVNDITEFEPTADEQIAELRQQIENATTALNILLGEAE